MFSTFVLIYGIQSMDKNFKKKSRFDRFKLPILSSAIVGLIAQYSCEQLPSKSSVTQDIFTEIPNF